MPRTAYKTTFAPGLVTDPGASNAPPEAFTDGEGFTVRGQRLIRAPSGVQTHQATGTSVLQHVVPFTDASGTVKWLWAGQGGARVVSSSGIATTSAITASTVQVSVVNFGGTPVVSFDGGNAYYLDGDEEMADLPWDATTTWAEKGWHAKVMAPYKNFLVAINYYDGVTRYHNSVIWSDAAEPGTLPSSWNVADTSKLGGSQSFAGTGRLITGAPLRDSFVIYGETIVSRMTLIPGDTVNVMRFDEISGVAGAIGPRAVTEADGYHFVCTVDDVVTHAGGAAESICDGTVRKALFASIDPAYYDRVQVARVGSLRELWVCVPEVGTGGGLSLAWVYDLTDGSWSRVTLPGTSYSVQELPSLDQSSAARPIASVYDAAGAKLIDMSSGYASTATVVRKGLVIDGRPWRKHCVGLRAEASGGAFTVRVGASETEAGTYTWGQKETITPSTDTYHRYRGPSGLYHAYEVEATNTSSVELWGLTLDFETTGER